MAGSTPYFVLLLSCLLAGIFLGANMASAQTHRLEDVGSSFHAYEEIPPTVTEPAAPKRIFIAQPHTKNVNIDCRADGNPKPIISWYRNGEKIVDDQDMQVLASGKLLFKDFYRTENGYYQCRAENRFGLSLSQIQHIQYDVRVGGNDEIETQNVTEYEPLSIPCGDLPVMPRMMFIHWYDKGNKNTEIKVTDRVGPDVTGTLHFAYTLMEDNKSYWCGVVTASSSKINFVRQAKLEVNRRSDEDGESHAKPTVAFSTANAKAAIGNKAVLECFFSAKPVAKITWKNSSNHVIESGGDPRFTVEDFGRRLVIDKVRQLDEGKFACTGTNDYGSVNSVIDFNVTAPPRPAPNGVLTSKTVPDNGSIRLPCKLIAATGEHLDTPRWFRNGVPLNQSNVPSPRYKFSSDYQELLIEDLNKQEDTANFQCNTSNSEGSQFYDAYLRVINSIIITKKPADVSEIEYGDVIDISIEAKGDHCCLINKMWRLNGTDLNEDTFKPFQKIPGSPGRLLFNTSRVTEEKVSDMFGRYTCRVSNHYQSISVTFNILPKASKMVPKIAAKSGGIQIWLIALVAGLALIILAIIVVVVVYKSKYPGSTYKLEEQEIKHNLNPEEDLLNQSFHEI